MKCKLYDVPGVNNIRDIGGYETADGRTVRHGRFVRAASLAGLTDEGMAALRKIGVDCVVDLRSTMETTHAPDAEPLRNSPQIRHVHVPMFDYVQTIITTGDITMFPASMAEMYAGLLENSMDEFARIFEIFAGPCQTALYHCTAGKDRTGVTTMLLLDLAGVDEDSIVEDYTYTERLLPQINRSPNLPAYLYGSKAETMRAAIAHLRERWGGAADYLRAAGLSDGVLQTIAAKLLDDRGGEAL